MNRRSQKRNAGLFLRKGSRPFLRDERGSVLIYIFIAIALLAALSFAMTRDNASSVSTQVAYQASEELISQANLIRSAILECTLEFPQGGPDTDADDIIATGENPNNPYPLNPLNANNPGGAAANDNVENLVCVTDGSTTDGDGVAGTPIFQGTNNQGRFLPPPPSGWPAWTYINDGTGAGTGVRIRIDGPETAEGIQAVTRVLARFNNVNMALNNEGGCGQACLTVWIHQQP